MSGTTIKDTWTKPRGGWDQGWEVGMAGVGSMVGGKWRQVFLNNSKKIKLKIAKGIDLMFHDLKTKEKNNKNKGTKRVGKNF